MFQVCLWRCLRKLIGYQPGNHINCRPKACFLCPELFFRVPKMSIECQDLSQISFVSCTFKKYELSKYYLLELEDLCHSILVSFHVLHLKENMKLLLVLNECMKLDCLFEWIKVEKICNAQKYCVLIKLYFGYTKGLRSRRLSLFLLWRIPLRFSQSLKVCQANVSRLHPSLYILQN